MTARTLPRPSGPASGFTLVELMITVAIMSILLAIGIPKFADLIRKSKEGATRGNLGSLKSALTIYYGDTEGLYPADDLASLTAYGGKYVQLIPEAKVPNYHLDTASVLAGASRTAVTTDLAGWSYISESSDAEWGAVFVNCTHTDVKGDPWTHY